MEREEILIIDDQPGNLHLLSNILTKAGYETCQALNGKNGIKVAKTQHPDLILLDIRMPEMDGFKVIQELKKHTETQNIPVIFVSALDDAQGKVKAFQGGGVDYITKPYEGSEVLARVKTHLSTRETLKLLENRTLQLSTKTRQLEKEIEERKQVETELRRLATVVEQMTESVMITDTSGKIEYVNPAFEQITGYSSKEATGLSFDFLKSHKQKKSVSRNIWESISEGKPWNGYVITEKKDGTQLEEMMTVSPIRNESGYISNHVFIKNDVTHERELEKQLSQAQKMEAIGTLAGGFAHYFNNILQGIFMAAQLAEKDFVGKELTKKYLHQIFALGQRASGLLKEVLAFSRQAEAEYREIQINLALKKIIKVMKKMLPNAIELQTDICGSCGNISGNLTQIYQVVMNLCSNAEYSMKDKGGILGVKLEELLFEKRKDGLSYWKGEQIPQRKYLKLTISDTGTGISPEELEHIFDPFYTTKDQGEGTGMGLAVVHGIIKGHEGYIAVESTLGEGTTFTLLFPVLE